MDILRMESEDARWRPTELGALVLHTAELLERIEALEARLEALDLAADRRQDRTERALDALEGHIDGLRGDLQDHEWRNHR